MRYSNQLADDRTAKQDNFAILLFQEEPEASSGTAKGKPWGIAGNIGKTGGFGREYSVLSTGRSALVNYYSVPNLLAPAL